MSNAILLLELLQTVRAGIDLARDLGVNYSAVAKRVEEVESSGREFSLADAHAFVLEARAELDKFAADLAARKAREAANP